MGRHRELSSLGTRVRRRRRRSALRAIGLSSVLLGIVLLGSVAYELWGTGISTARAQSHLRAELSTGFPATASPGGPDGLIQIPRIHLDMAFVEGVSPDDLAKGPGHYPGTPMPGQGGNVVIAGHRTTHLAPFWSLNVLEPGDEIALQTVAGRFLYQVQYVMVLPGNAWYVTNSTSTPALTLTTCNPRFASTERLVVRAVQVEGPIPGGYLHPGEGIVERF